jgi:hypothetical protein
MVSSDYYFLFILFTSVLKFHTESPVDAEPRSRWLWDISKAQCALIGNLHVADVIDRLYGKYETESYCNYSS